MGPSAAPRRLSGYACANEISIAPLIVALIAPTSLTLSGREEERQRGGVRGRCSIARHRPQSGADLLTFRFSAVLECSPQSH